MTTPQQHAKRSAEDLAAARRRLALKHQLRAQGILFPESARYDEAALRALLEGAAS